MKIIIKCAKRQEPMVEPMMSWQWKERKVSKMLKQKAKKKTSFNNTSRIIIHKELENRNIQALYEDLGYLKEGEFNSYLENL